MGGRQREGKGMVLYRKNKKVVLLSICIYVISSMALLSHTEYYNSCGWFLILRRTTNRFSLFFLSLLVMGEFIPILPKLSTVAFHCVFSTILSVHRCLRTVRAGSYRAGVRSLLASFDFELLTVCLA